MAAGTNGLVDLSDNMDAADVDAVDDDSTIALVDTIDGEDDETLLVCQLGLLWVLFAFVTSHCCCCCCEIFGSSSCCSCCTILVVAVVVVVSFAEARDGHGGNGGNGGACGCASDCCCDCGRECNVMHATAVQMDEDPGLSPSIDKPPTTTSTIGAGRTLGRTCDNLDRSTSIGFCFCSFFGLFVAVSSNNEIGTPSWILICNEGL